MKSFAGYWDTVGHNSFLPHRQYTLRCDRNHANPFPTWPIYTTPQSSSSSDHIGQRVAPPGGVTKWSRKSLWRPHRWNIQISTSDDLGDTKRNHHKGLGFFGMQRGWEKWKNISWKRAGAQKHLKKPWNHQQNLDKHLWSIFTNARALGKGSHASSVLSKVHLLAKQLNEMVEFQPCW